MLGGKSYQNKGWPVKVNNESKFERLLVCVHQVPKPTAWTRDEFVPIPCLDHAAVIKHHDTIRSSNRREAMGDEYDRQLSVQLIDSLLDTSFVLCVKGAGRLVEEK